MIEEHNSSPEVAYCPSLLPRYRGSISPNQLFYVVLPETGGNFCV